MNASLTMWNSNNNGCYSYEADGYFHFKKSQSGPLHLPEGRNSGSCIKSKHSIFRHDNFIGCFSADKIKMSARK